MPDIHDLPPVSGIQAGLTTRDIYPYAPSGKAGLHTETSTTCVHPTRSLGRRHVYAIYPLLRPSSRLGRWALYKTYISRPAFEPVRTRHKRYSSLLCLVVKPARMLVYFIYTLHDQRPSRIEYRASYNIHYMSPVFNPAWTLEYPTVASAFPAFEPARIPNIKRHSPCEFGT